MSNYTDSLEFENDILKDKNKQLREALSEIVGCSGSVTGCFSSMKDIAEQALEATK